MSSTNAELAVLIPTYGRPQSLRPLVGLFAETTPGHRIYLVMESRDRASIRAAEGLPTIDVIGRFGSYAIAVNAGIRASEEPLILCGADDIRPHTGWLEAARAHLSEEIGFVSLNDLGNERVMSGDYATLPLLSRRYVEELDEDFYHEGYQHCCCDVDASRVARSRGAYVYAPEAIMEHLHPDWGKGKPDATYERSGMNKRKRIKDRALLRSRWPE
jgi:hypothetical protein